MLIPAAWLLGVQMPGFRIVFHLMDSCKDLFMQEIEHGTSTSSMNLTVGHSSYVVPELTLKLCLFHQSRAECPLSTLFKKASLCLVALVMSDLGDQVNFLRFKRLQNKEDVVVCPLIPALWMLRQEDQCKLEQPGLPPDQPCQKHSHLPTSGKAGFRGLSRWI